MEIISYNIEDILILEFQGDLKKEYFSKIKPFILKIVMEDYKKIILDMNQVKDVDSEWCRFLISMYKIMNIYGRKLVIARCSDCLLSIACSTGIVSLYSFYSSLEEAKECFQSVCLHKK